MKITLAKTAGFCFGVNRAVQSVYDLLDKGERVCTLGPIIHSPQLVEELKQRGVRIVESPEEVKDGETLVIRSHGVERSVTERAKELGVKDNVISYWCNGTRKPNFEQIIRMSQFFNVSTDYLLGVTSAPTNDKDVQFICDYTGLTERTVKILNNMKNRDFKQPITINEQGYNTFFDYKHAA